MAETIKLNNVTKRYKTSASNLIALDNINLTIIAGSIHGIIGMSGAGKSTLVRCINLLERPDEGQVLIGDIDLMQLSNKDLLEKRKKIGMIFQHFNLLLQKNILDNVALPLVSYGMKKKEARKKALDLLDLVSLKDKAKAYPVTLSGGQKQRVAIARALAQNPEILLCDEATSALDPETTSQVLSLLKKINKELKITIVIITHEMSVVKKICDNVSVLNSGKIVENGSVKEVFSKIEKKNRAELINFTANNYDEYEEVI